MFVTKQSSLLWSSTIPISASNSCSHSLFQQIFYSMKSSWSPTLLLTMVHAELTFHLAQSKTESHSSRNKSKVVLQILPNYICSDMKFRSSEWHYVEETTGLNHLDILYCYFGFTTLATQEKLNLTEPVQWLFIVDHTDRARKRIMQKWSRAWFLFSYTTTENIFIYLACYVPSNVLYSQTQIKCIV